MYEYCANDPRNYKDITGFQFVAGMESRTLYNSTKNMDQCRLANFSEGMRDSYPLVLDIGALTGYYLGIVPLANILSGISVGVTIGNDYISHDDFDRSYISISTAIISTYRNRKVRLLGTSYQVLNDMNPVDFDMKVEVDWTNNYQNYNDLGIKPSNIQTRTFIPQLSP